VLFRGTNFREHYTHVSFINMCIHIYLIRISCKFDYIRNDIRYTRVEFPSNIINCAILKIHWEWRNTADSLLSWKSWDHTSIKCTVSKLGETKEINSNVSRIYRRNICGRTIICNKKIKVSIFIQSFYHTQKLIEIHSCGKLRFRECISTRGKKSLTIDDDPAVSSEDELIEIGLWGSIFTLNSVMLNCIKLKIQFATIASTCLSWRKNQ